MTVLEDTYELLSDPARWTQGADARDAEGRKVSVEDERAVCWCLSGALRFCLKGARVKEHRAARAALSAVPSIVDFNDSNDHQDVIKLLKEAINEQAR